MDPLEDITREVAEPLSAVPERVIADRLSRALPAKVFLCVRERPYADLITGWGLCAPWIVSVEPS